MSEEIDFVITWVNGADPAWLAEKQKYITDDGVDDRSERYRDWELLRFWFRGVEQYAPWVRKIHFVTCGHLPSWLNTEHPRLQIVRHEDFLPEGMLPTYNSAQMELYLHRIPGLAEQFVFFNDDMFLLRRRKPEHFFQNGKPCDMLAFQPLIANAKNPVMSHIYLNNMLVLAKYFEKRRCVGRHPGHVLHVGYPPLYFCYNLLEMLFGQFTGLYTVHGPSAFCRHTFEEIWEREEAYFTSLEGNRFRSDRDVNQYLVREWQKLSGNFKPRNVGRELRYFEITDSNEKLLRAIAGGKSDMVCINDTGRVENVEQVKGDLQEAFLKRLPEKSSFERQES